MTELSLKQRASKIFRILAKTYPEAKCELDFTSPFQLLTATILSAQCTDKAVNKVTGPLFKRYPDPLRLSRARQESVETMIRSIGLFRSKARSLVGMAQALVRDHQGEVPTSMEDLVKLPGVGRKTANVVRSNGFDLPGLAVDTHVLRVGKRLGLFTSKDPVKVEHALGALAKPEKWGNISHWLIWHGRRVCDARKPRCGSCPLLSLCRDPGRMAVAGRGEKFQNME